MARPSRSVSSGERRDRRQTRLAGKTGRREARDRVTRSLVADRLDGIWNLFNKIAGDHAG
jgi:hypothetical protein